MKSIIEKMNFRHCVEERDERGQRGMGNIFLHVKFNRAVAVPASILSFKAFSTPFR